MFSILGHPLMQPGAGFIELPMGLAFRDSIVTLLEHTTMRAVNHAVGE